MKRGYIVMRGKPLDPNARHRWGPMGTRGSGPDIQPASNGDAADFHAGIEALDDAELQDAYDDPKCSTSCRPTDRSG